MTKRFDWTGRKVLITGGSSGIGKQIAADLLGRGGHVAIVADGREKLEQAKSELERISPHVCSYVCDVGRLEDVEDMARAYLAAFDAPQVLINNAGYAVYDTFERLPIEEVRRLFDVNLGGAALVTRAFLPSMIRAGGGDVVMISSIAGRIPMTPCSVYSAAKHGMVALAELLRVETSGFNVRVQVVCPGRVETDFFKHESFLRRAHRPETTRTVPIDVVSRGTIRAIERNRFMTYIPRYYALFAWLAAALPILFKPILWSLMSARVRSVYDATQD